ncbi:MAG TPA: hypothetical protein VN581_12865 [Patescibacteria group bacterium]|nr:hypothetical protein [Patescibacteria group bacterium]
MKPALVKPVLIALCAVFALSGCEVLRVESLPTGEIIACDKDFVGWWRVESESVEADDDTLHLHLDNDCTHWTFVENDADGQRKQEDLSTQMRFDFRRVGDARYLAASDVPDNPDDKHDVGEGFALLRYVVRADRIDLFEGDPRREAHRVAEGLIRGTVESGSHARCGENGNCSVNTTITGDGDAIADWLKRFDPIDRSFMELRRVDARTTTELDELLKSPPADGKPRPHE